MSNKLSPASAAAAIFVIVVAVIAFFGWRHPFIEPPQERDPQSNAPPAGATGIAKRPDDATPPNAPAIPPPSGSSTVGATMGNKPPAHGPPDPFDSLVEGARERARREEPSDAAGRFTRTRLIAAPSFKYTLLRVVETLELAAKRGSGNDTGDRLVDRKIAVADHVMVKLTGPDAEDAFLAAMAGSGFKLRKTIPLSGVYVVAADTDVTLDTVPNLVARLSSAGDFIRFVEPDYVAHAFVTTPDDPDFAELWGLNNTGQTGGTPDADIDAVEAWDIATGDARIVVGVIDTGIKHDHPDLAGNIWVNPGEIAGDHIDNDENGYVDDVHGYDFVNNDGDPMDDHSHGTHCAGTIGGRGGNGTGVSGVAWKVSLMGLKFLDGNGFGATSDAVEALAYATANGAHLTSNSWGGGGPDAILESEIEIARDNNKIFVAAAGNSSLDIEILNVFPAGYPTDNIISVAALDHNDALAGFSNFGATRVDLGAPGVGILSSVIPDGYAEYSGTSMACPHVAGACALLLSVDPAIPYADLKERILVGVDPVAALNGRTLTGGRLNLFNSISAASGPYLLLEDAFIHDETTGVTDGNGDGFVNRGETIGVTLDLRNLGVDPADGVTAVLTPPASDPKFNVTGASITVGAIDSNSQPGSRVVTVEQFIIQINRSATTPHSGIFTVQCTDIAGRSWDYELEIVISTSETISGIVREAAAPNDPIPTATVSYSGPVSGTAAVDATGFYSFVAIDGEYTLSASAPGFLPDGPFHKAISQSSGPQTQDFFLGFSDIDIATTPITVTLAEGARETRLITIGNLGNRGLDFTAAGLAANWTSEPGSLWHKTGHRYFEHGSSYYYGIENQWNYFTGGTHSGALVSDPFVVPAGNPHFEFEEWLETEGFDPFDIALVQISIDGGEHWEPLGKSFDTSGTFQTTSVDLSPYADQLVQVRFFFDTVDSFFNAFEGWYLDAIAMEGTPMDWLAVSPTAGTTAPGASDGLTVTFDAANLPPGVYTHQVAIFSNDTDEQRTDIPVTLTVTGGVRLYFSSRTVDDTATGDGDGSAEPGESVQLNVDIENAGVLPSTALSATLTSADPNVTITQGNSTYASIPAAGTGTGTTPFAIDVSPAAPDDAEAIFLLTLTDAGGFARALEFSIGLSNQVIVTGTVTDLGTGLPIENATVSGGTNTTTTDAGGNYVLGPFTSGNFEIECSTKGYKSKSIAVTLATADVVADFALGFPLVTLADDSLTRAIFPGQSAMGSVAILNSGSLPANWKVNAIQQDYSFADSDDPGGPAFDWIEIADPANLVAALDTDDETVTGVSIGFPFPFYGDSFSDVGISTEGYLSFTDGENDNDNTPLPNPFAPGNLIAVCWIDLNLDPAKGGAVYRKQVDANTFVVQWEAAPLSSIATKKVTAQAVLKSDGRILLQYKSVAKLIAAYVTAGIQNEGGTEGVGVSFKDRYLKDNLAVELTRDIDLLSLVANPSYKDSTDPSGPAFHWIDISTVGPEVTDAGDDTNSGPFPLGFEFPYFGESYEKVHICSNGWLSFTDTGNSLSARVLPDQHAPENVIALFWDDLNRGAGGKIYYRQFDPDTFIVQFDDLPRFGDLDTTVTCQAILKSSGDIKLQYRTVTASDAATVAIQNASGYQGMTISHKDPGYPFSNLAIEINQGPVIGHIQGNDLGGTVAAVAGTAVIPVYFDAAGLEPGVYVTPLAVHTDDVNVPVEPFGAALIVRDPAPGVTIDSPSMPRVYLPDGKGIVLEATVTDGRLTSPPGNVTTLWSTVTGPAAAIFDDASAPDSAVRFPLPGTYVLNLRADDGSHSGADEVTVVVGSTPEGVDDTDRVVYYNLDETSGFDAIDSEGSDNNGLLNNGPAWLGPGGGIVGGALEFDGVDDHISIPDSPDINTEGHAKRTVAFWFNATAPSATGRHVLYEEGGPACGLNFYLQHGGLFFSGFNGGVNDWDETFLATSAPESGWHHLALVLDAPESGLRRGALRAYLDGAMIGSGLGANLEEHSNDIGMGAMRQGTRFHDGGEGSQDFYFEGAVDEFYLFNRALPVDELRSLMIYENAAPRVDPGPDQYAIPGLGTTLAGAVTDDTKPGPLVATPTWQCVSGPAGGTLSFSSPDATGIPTVVHASKSGHYRVRLLADDGHVTSFDEIVLGFATQYGSWFNSFPGTAGAESTPFGDPFMTGGATLLHYALGGDPTDGASLDAFVPRGPTAVDAGSGESLFHFTYRRRRDAAARGLTYTVEVCDQNGPNAWVASGYTQVDLTVIDADFEEVTVRLDEPMSIAGAAKVVRLRVNLNEY